MLGSPSRPFTAPCPTDKSSFQHRVDGTAQEGQGRAGVRERPVSGGLDHSKLLEVRCRAGRLMETRTKNVLYLQVASLSHASLHPKGIAALVSWHAPSEAAGGNWRGCRWQCAGHCSEAPASSVEEMTTRCCRPLRAWRLQPSGVQKASGPCPWWLFCMPSSTFLGQRRWTFLGICVSHTSPCS